MSASLVCKLHVLTALPAAAVWQYTVVVVLIVILIVIVVFFTFHWSKDMEIVIITHTTQHIYRVYQNDWSGFEVDYIHKYGEQNYKYQ